MFGRLWKRLFLTYFFNPFLDKKIIGLFRVGPKAPPLVDIKGITLPPKMIKFEIKSEKQYAQKMLHFQFFFTNDSLLANIIYL